MLIFKRLVREPLVHFLLLGAVLFGLYEWRGGQAGAGGSTFVVTTGLIERLSASFVQTWKRPPNEIELKGLIDDYVKEEIATREALEMGLDRDDTVIRRRLRQKLEFLLVDDARPAPASDAELHAWLTRHPDSFRLEPKLAFRQVYLNPVRHGEHLSADAEKLLAQLRAAGPHAAIDKLGDSTMLPADQPLDRASEVARTFGEAFAQNVLKLEPGQWAGPVESSFGVHLVWVAERQAGKPADLADVRPLVEREVQAERRQASLQAMYDRLLSKYTIKVEAPAQSGRGGSARAAP